MIDIVAQPFDAGVRLGQHLAKNAIAVRIGPDVRIAVVAVPSYLSKRNQAEKPKVGLAMPLTTCVCQHTVARFHKLHEKMGAR